MDKTNKINGSFILVAVVILIVAGVFFIWANYFSNPAPEPVMTISHTKDKPQAPDSPTTSNETETLEQSEIANTEFLPREGKDLIGQAEKIQLVDGTFCTFINGATDDNDKGERLNYQCGDFPMTMVIYGDLTTGGDVWKANVSKIKRNTAQNEWDIVSTETIDIAKVWR